MRQTMQLVLLALIILILFGFWITRYRTKMAHLQGTAGVETFKTASTPEVVAYHPEDWQKIDDEIRDSTYGILHSVIVVQNDQQVFEKYYNKWQPHEIHDLQSATKSVVSLLIGIAI